MTGVWRMETTRARKSSIKNRLPVALTMLMAGLGTSAVQSADMSYLGSIKVGKYPQHTLLLSGPIEAGDTERLKAVIDKLKASGQSIFRNTTLTLNSPGGALDPAIELLNFVRENGLATHIAAGARCLSGCGLVFMAGTWLDGDDTKDTNRVMNPKGTLGFHAPFAFDKNKELPAEIANLLLADSERGGVLASAKLVKLSQQKILPVSLVEELLQYESGSFLYIDTVDRAGRWKIPLEGEGWLQTANGIVTRSIWQRLNEHCNNQINWSLETSFENRTDPHGLTENQLWFDGLDNGCRYKAGGKLVRAEIAQHQGPGNVLYWQTLPADTKLADITKDQLTGAIRDVAAFNNPPPSQIDGKCFSNYQWIGGWAGAFFSDSIAHASYRHCQTGHIPFKLECKHGSGQIETRIALRSFGVQTVDASRVKTQTDNNLQLGSNGRVVNDRGIPEFSSILPRNYFTFKNLKRGKQHFITINNKRYAIHLSGARAAIEAMERSCL